MYTVRSNALQSPDEASCNAREITERFHKERDLRPRASGNFNTFSVLSVITDRHDTFHAVLVMDDRGPAYIETFAFLRRRMEMRVLLMIRLVLVLSWQVLAWYFNLRVHSTVRDLSNTDVAYVGP